MYPARFACASCFSERASKLHTTQGSMETGQFVLLAMMLCVSNVIILPYQKENLLGRKWYVSNLGTATFDERKIIESEIEERCLGEEGGRDKAFNAVI